MFLYDFDVMKNLESWEELNLESWEEFVVSKHTQRELFWKPVPWFQSVSFRHADAAQRKRQT